jgi:hypothetical protein
MRHIVHSGEFDALLACTVHGATREAVCDPLLILCYQTGFRLDLTPPTTTVPVTKTFSEPQKMPKNSQQYCRHPLITKPTELSLTQTAALCE